MGVMGPMKGRFRSRVTRQGAGGGRCGSAGASPSRGVLSAVGSQARPNQFERGTRGAGWRRPSEGGTTSVGEGPAAQVPSRCRRRVQ